MEKRHGKSIVLVVTGPESTGKSTISEYLANEFGGECVPEYAREYIGRLNRKYSFEDVEHIARNQIGQYHNAVKSNGLFFFDTWLVITKIWFGVVFGKVPSFVEKEIESAAIGGFLLCAPDIPWVHDPLRENGGERRVELYNIYEKEIVKLGAPYIKITGEGNERLKNARMAAEELIIKYRK